MGMSEYSTVAEFRDVWRITTLRVSAKSGGYQFRQHGSAWINTRDGGELFASLSRYLSEQTGTPVTQRSD